MKIIQSNSISINGLLARENGEEDWLPSEGWDEFVEDVAQFGNIIMGRETYELVMKLYPDYNFDSVQAKLKVIVTTKSDYKCPPGYSVVYSPKEAVELINDSGFEVGLLIGGGGLNSSFFEEGLIDEAWVTINPIILGRGRPFIRDKDFEVEFELKEIKKLNKSRVQLKYKVISNSIRNHDPEL